MKNVHTEYCCVIHGCKYGEKDCPVYTKRQKQSFPCESCEEDIPPLKFGDFKMKSLDKIRLYIVILSMMLYLIGCIIVGLINWKLLIGIILMMWGNNLGLLLKFDPQYSSTLNQLRMVIDKSNKPR